MRTLSVLIFLASCAPYRGPVDPVAIRKEILAHPALFDRIEYNPPEELVAPIIDEVVAKAVERRKGTPPKSIAFLEANSAWSAVLASPGGPALFEAAMRRYWGNPTIKSSASEADVDLGIAPGRITLDSRKRPQIAHEFVEDQELRTEEVVRQFQNALTRHPGKRVYKLRVTTYLGWRARTNLTYRYDTALDRLWVDSVSGSFVSSAPLGGIANLRSARIRDLSMQGANPR